MNTKHISKQQLQEDFKQVVLYFTCETIHKFFDDEPKKMFKAIKDSTVLRSTHGDTFKSILRNLVRINIGIGVPRDLPKAMFRRGAKRCVLEYVDEMVAKGEFKVLNNGVLPTKQKQHFMKKYLLPLSVLEDFFADKNLAKIMLENRIQYWTKRQNRFIGKELDRRLKLKGQREVFAVKKQIEREETELEEQVNGLLDEMDI